METGKSIENEQQVIEDELKKSADSNPESSKSHGKILAEQLFEASETYKRSTAGTFYSSLIAGLEIGFSYLLLCTVFNFFSPRYSEAVVFKLMALVYPAGFILVILGKSLLFTEQTSLLSLPFFHGKESIVSLLKLWGTVIAGNILGGFVISIVLLWIGPQLHIFNKEDVEKIAVHISSFRGEVIFASGILAGWLMGLLSWLLTSTKDTISKIFIIALITSIMSFTNLHHSIIGNIEIFSGLISSSKITFNNYLLFQTMALSGNAIGGFVFVGLFKYRSFTAGLINN
jgi:formate/nitrite transporter FocA (FNT family)